MARPIISCLKNGGKLTGREPSEFGHRGECGKLAGARSVNIAGD